MIDETIPKKFECRPIPLDQIAETRARFGHLRICYEVDLATDEAWRGLEAAARAFGSAGLDPVALRLTRNGTISCKLSDTRTVDLTTLDDALVGEAGLRVVSWTTVIESNDRA
jgi:hypothetical protein